MQETLLTVEDRLDHDPARIAVAIEQFAERLVQCESVGAYLNTLPAERSAAVLLGMLIVVKSIRSGRVESVANQLMGRREVSQ